MSVESGDRVSPVGDAQQVSFQGRVVRHQLRSAVVIPIHQRPDLGKIIARTGCPEAPALAGKVHYRFAHLSVVS